MIQLYIDKIADLEAVAVILVRNGYTVTQKKRKDGTKIVRYLEANKDGCE